MIDWHARFQAIVNKVDAEISAAETFTVQSSRRRFRVPKNETVIRFGGKRKVVEITTADPLVQRQIERHGITSIANGDNKSRIYSVAVKHFRWTASATHHDGQRVG